SRRRHTRLVSDWSSDVCSSDLPTSVPRGSAGEESCVKMAVPSDSRSEPGKQTLTVPQFILNAMPAATSDRGYLFLAMHPFQNAFAAAGVDAGYFIDFSSDWKQLAYQ